MVSYSIHLNNIIEIKKAVTTITNWNKTKVKIPFNESKVLIDETYIEVYCAIIGMNVWWDGPILVGSKFGTEVNDDNFCLPRGSMLSCQL